jgi:tRNA(Arg) A34 adenosine deaminase TadA
LTAIAGLDSGDIFTPNANGFHNIPRLYLLAALALEHKRGASVAALVVNAEGLVIARGFKAHGEQGCGHAEVKALFSVRGNLPPRWMLVSTLKPCTMCAGLIQALEGRSDQQYWARDDPSTGASFDKVNGLALKNGQSTVTSAKDAINVRSIKLQGGSSFTDQFTSSWAAVNGRRPGPRRRCQNG